MDYSGYGWIKVKRYVDDTSLSWEERYKRLEQHHMEETTFLINKVRQMAGSNAPQSKDVTIKCVGCKKGIEVLHDGDTPADQAAYDNGLVHSVVAGYGSKHDTDQFLIGICDECIDVFKEDGRLIGFQ